MDTGRAILSGTFRIVRSFRFLHGCLFATMTVAACGGSSKQQPDEDAGMQIDTSRVADADAATDVADALSGDTHDAVELDASVSCSSTTCGPGEVCVHERGGVPDASLEDNCYPIPSGCDGVPTCACVSGLAASFRCGMSCTQIGGREFMCMGA